MKTQVLKILFLLFLINQAGASDLQEKYSSLTIEYVVTSTDPTSINRRRSGEVTINIVEQDEVGRIKGEYTIATMDQNCSRTKVVPFTGRITQTLITISNTTPLPNPSFDCDLLILIDRRSGTGTVKIGGWRGIINSIKYQAQIGNRGNKD